MAKTEIASGLWMISAPGYRVPINCYLIDTGAGLLLFDTGPRNNGSVILDHVRQLGFTARDLKWIVLSHSHAAHIGALAKIAEQTGAHVFAHPAAEGWLIDHQRQFRERYERFSDRLPLDETFKNYFFDRLGRPWYPNTWIETFPLSLDTPRSMEIRHTPGHSSDSISLYLKEEGILICGDAFMGAGTGNTLPRYDDPEAYTATLTSFLELQPNLLLSAHFAPLSREKLQPALQQSQTMVELLHRFIHESLKRRPDGYDIGFLTRMVTARFSRITDVVAAIPVQAHLMALEREGKVHFEIDRWKPGAPKQSIVIESIIR